MIRRSWGVLCVLAVSLALLGEADPPEEEACEAELNAFRDGPWQAWRQRDARENLLRRLDDMIERYRPTAPRCEGRLREYQTYVFVHEDRYEEAAAIVSDYLEGPGRHADASLKIRLIARRSYALERMGEIRESSQGYFSAARLAKDVEARFGVTALMDAAISAYILRDRGAVTRYLNEASRLIADSLQGSHDHDRLLGRVYVNRALLVEDELLDIRDDEMRRELAQRLKSITERAQELLPTTNALDRGNRAIMIGANALALAVLGEHDLARQRALPVIGMAERSRDMIPYGPYRAWHYLSRLEEARGDLGSARRSTIRARREAIKLGNRASERFMTRRLGHFAEARGDWEEARRIYTEAVAHGEVDRERLGLQDWTAQAFGQIESLYRGLVRSHLALGDPEAAFLALDQTRARYLRDLRGHLDVRSRLTSDQRDQADSVQTALEEARLALLRSDLGGEDLATASYAISTLQEQLEAITGNTMGPAPDLDLDLLQAALSRRDQTLISYFLDPDGSTAFVVRPDTFVAVPLQATPESLEALLRSVGSPWAQGASADDPAFRLGALHDLYLEIIAPLLPWIADATSITVVPDRPLGGIPFGMLITAPADDYAEAPYLVREVAIATELSASMIPEAESGERPSAPSLDLLALGRSNFRSAGFTWNEDNRLDDLPHVDDEVKRIGAGIRSKDIALNDDATEERLARHIADARIVHLASHAESDPRLPLYSKIALWDSGEDDGTLYLYELQSQSLNADLVVLSGCSTARGQHQDGEGMVGLQYAVRSAGARASLATLWPVDDQATVEVMAGFYDGLKRGLPKDRALQQAQIAYLDAHEGLRASPFFWASPILSGDTAPVPLDVTRGRTGWVVLTLAAVGLGVAWRLRRRRLDV